MVWFIALGSALGGAARYWLGAFLQQRAGTLFPVGTLVINIVGSFLLAFIFRYVLSTTAVSPELRGFLTAGFCGGFTTFSTFTYDTVLLVEEGELSRAAAYVLLSVALALLAAFLGIVAARGLLAFREGT